MTRPGLAWIPLRLGTVVALALALACTAPAAPPARGADAAPAAPLVTAGPAPAASGTAAPPAPEAPPEKSTLAIGAVLTGSLYLPLIVAQEAGYFQAHGLTVEVSGLAASAAAQALVAGSVDMYLGGATAIAAHLAGNDIIYVGAAVDKSSLVLIGEPGITSFPDFRGKTIATTSPGAFGEIALFQTAKEFGMVPGQDFALNYSANSDTVYAVFTSKATQGAITSPPSSLRLLDEGYPLVIDYYQRGLKIVGPGMSVTRAFSQAHPNTIKAFQRAYLDATKRVFDDRAYATDVTSRFTKIDDPKLLDQDYELGLKIWNKDLTVDRAAIEVVLQNSPLPNAKDADPNDFYDNSLIAEVNATYGARLFPELAGR
ncbi:MAG TPA: ABC transporter substrate-binding protein [Chloroflexota bacterium]|jgi:ABC-type nitrate/sulfonate/bicarbonate transport system substrate-binding protein